MESSAKTKIWYWVFAMGRGLHLWCPNHSKSRNRCLNLWVKLIGNRPQQSTFTGLLAGLVILYSYTWSWSWSKYSSRNCWWNYCNSNNQVWGSHDYVCLASWQPLPVCTHSGNTRIPLWHSHPQTGILLWVNMKWRLHWDWPAHLAGNEIQWCILWFKRST